jgi:hypothetical protein
MDVNCDEMLPGVMKCINWGMKIRSIIHLEYPTALLNNFWIQVFLP